MSSGIALSLSSCYSKVSEDNQKSVKINAGCTYPFDSLHPVANVNITSRSALLHVCEGLYNIDYSNYKTYCGLAAQKPIKINELTYDIVLRDEVYFSNGKRLEANDVINSFRRNLMDPQYSLFLDFIKDISIKDCKTLTFYLKYPFDALLEQRLSLVFIFPANQSDEQLCVAPIGTGPWKIDSTNFDIGQIEFDVNRSYIGKYSYRKKPMTWKTISDNNSRVQSLLNQETDIIDFFSEIYTKDLLLDDTVEYIPSNAGAYLLFNLKNKLINNQKFRQAVFYAVNTQNIIDKYFDGHAYPALSFLPKTHKNYNQASTIYNFNPDLSKSLLKELDVSEVSLNLVVEDSWVTDILCQIIEDLDNVGIHIEISGNNLDNDHYDIALISGDASILTNDTDLLLSFWFGDNKWTTKYTSWKTIYPDKWLELDKLLKNARETQNSNTQQYIWNQCFDIIASNCVLHPLLHKELGIAYKNEMFLNYPDKSSSGLYFLGCEVK